MFTWKQNQTLMKAGLLDLKLTQSQHPLFSQDNISAAYLILTKFSCVIKKEGEDYITIVLKLIGP